MQCPYIMMVVASIVRGKASFAPMPTESPSSLLNWMLRPIQIWGESVAAAAAASVQAHLPIRKRLWERVSGRRMRARNPDSR